MPTVTRSDSGKCSGVKLGVHRGRTLPPLSLDDEYHTAEVVVRSGPRSTDPQSQVPRQAPTLPRSGPGQRTPASETKGPEVREGTDSARLRPTDERRQYGLTLLPGVGVEGTSSHRPSRETTRDIFQGGLGTTGPDQIRYDPEPGTDRSGVT